ncbi:MAG: MotA/TolQ/ExbB proton channel family protein [Gammaproteobacteria bacterium]
MLKRLAPAALLALALPARAADFDFAGQLQEGGVAIVVILGLSILALAVAIERLVRFRKRAVIPDGLAAHAQMLWQGGDFTQLQEVAADGSTLGKMIGFMAANRHHDYDFVHSRVSDIASLSLRRHQQRGYALAIVATVAPIVGLLGTVIGMIEAFHVIASADGMGNPALLAGGISKALINTAAGLSVALPALGMHHFLRNRVVSYGLQLEEQIEQLMNLWFEPAKAAGVRLVAGHGH